MRLEQRYNSYFKTIRTLSQASRTQSSIKARSDRGLLRLLLAHLGQLHALVRVLLVALELRVHALHAAEFELLDLLLPALGCVHAVAHRLERRISVCVVLGLDHAGGSVADGHDSPSERTDAQRRRD